jgi:hypothetical protein
MIKNIFSTYLYRVKFHEYQKTYKKILPILEKLWSQDTALIPPWISTGWTRSSFPRLSTMDPIGKRLDTVPEMAEAMDFIYNSCEEYFKLLNIRSDLKPDIQEMWAQRYVEGVGDNHNHTKYLLGGGLYLLVEGEQTITFEHPSVSLYEKSLLTDFDQTALTETILLEPGDLILWPGWMNHQIVAKKPNNWKSGPTRITLPFMANGLQ